MGLITDPEFKALPTWLKFVHSFKMLYKTHPVVVVALPHFFVGFAAYFYQFYHERYEYMEYIPRFRARYTVYRPDDPRVMLLPKSYITDKQYLSPDHPEHLEDRIITRLPYVGFRQNQQRINKEHFD